MVRLFLPSSTALSVLAICAPLRSVLPLTLTITRHDPRLLAHARVVRIHPAAAGIDAGTRSIADGRTAANALIPALEGTVVLHAGDVQVPSHIGHDLVTSDGRADQIRIPSGIDIDLTTRTHLRHDVGDILAIAVAPATRRIGGKAELGLRTKLRRKTYSSVRSA